MGKIKITTEDEDESMQIEPKRRRFKKTYCPDCKYYMRRGDEHCEICEVCIHKMDHHCVFFSKCVGKGNIFWFNATLVGACVTIMYFFIAGML